MGLLLLLFRGFLLAYILVTVLVVIFSERLIFQPRTSSYRDGPGIIKLTSADNIQIAAIYLPNPTAEYTILYSHGNAEDLGDILPWIKELQSRGFAVMSYDYRGYGMSAGNPSEKGVCLDIEAAYNYLTVQLGVLPQRVILHGYSVGGGPTLALASRLKRGGVVLESTFTTTFRTVTLIPLFPFDRFKNIDKIGKINLPILVIHGRNDTVIPFSHGVRLFTEANGAKRFLWIEGAGHCDLKDKAGERYWNALREFTALVDAV